MTRYLTFVTVVLAGCSPAVAPLVAGDGLAYLGESNAPSFWESTDVEVVGDVAYVCTGVNSLTVHDWDETPESIEYERQVIFPGSHNFYPRCSHVVAAGDRLVVTSHRDEVQVTPWVALLDIERKDTPVVLDSFSTETPLEQAAVVGDRVFVAAHDAGVLRFDIGGGTLAPSGERAGLGNVARIAPFGSGLLNGMADGAIRTLGTDLVPGAPLDLGASVQALLDVGDGRAVAALGSAGLALVDVAQGTVLRQIDTRGTALRLDRLGGGDLLVANWSDLRVYSVTSEDLVLRAVDAVFQAGHRPRHLAAGAYGDVVVAGEWSGVHTLRHTPGVDAPELSPDDLLVKVAADGTPQQATLTLRNEGRLPLEVAAVEVPEGWSAAPLPAELAPDEAVDLELTFAGADTPQTGELLIHSDDPDEQPARVGLQAGASAVTIGDGAPDFSYEGLNTGETHTLSDQWGRVVLLSYFGVF